jgi:thiol:disulfide interchange protein DsbA
MIRRLIISLSLLVFSLSCAAEQESAQTYAAGTHYDVITPALRATHPGKITVAEFFWYGCGHCYSFEPLVNQWKKTVADDVQFNGVPAVWRKVMELHARAFYVAEALGVSDTLNPAIFQAINVDRKPLSTQDELAALFAANGVAADDFNKAFTSFGISSQVRQAVATAKAAKITGTPSLVVAGKYHVSAAKAGGQPGMLQVVDFLIEKERAAAKGS